MATTISTDILVGELGLALLNALTDLQDSFLLANWPAEGPRFDMDPPHISYSPPGPRYSFEVTAQLWGPERLVDGVWTRVHMMSFREQFWLPDVPNDVTALPAIRPYFVAAGSALAWNIRQQIHKGWSGVRNTPAAEPQMTLGERLHDTPDSELEPATESEHGPDS